ncbi:YdeI/OmpD-associated family protein [Actinomadura rudentiformis]|uniref:DUF1905 domain-containing protein n=1 Tax=Actinomadura rudentiformis TaxID=359158 RepID=A0A6H9YQ65_9ACTN|nr:YdeI/OmpD-associated family protein [Actinomadura rudentiformis]KAB2341328.1 DUF1905 domain-containing protein [Actinomadura rudentiformis]
MKFRATVTAERTATGNANGVEVPPEIVEALGSGQRPPVVITINGHTWRSRVAAMRGKLLIGISAANRKASGIAEGEEIEVDLQLDTEPRVVNEPPDLAAALDSDPAARAAFDRLAYSHRRKHVLAIEAAKTAETRQRRIDKAISTILSG